MTTPQTRVEMLGNIGPNWFASVMGTGIVATAGATLPVRVPGLQAFNQHRLFLEAVRDRTPPFVSLEDGLRDLAVVAAFYRALRTESTVAVDLMVGELVQSD